jgi:hypothetical protein
VGLCPVQLAPVLVMELEVQEVLVVVVAMELVVVVLGFPLRIHTLDFFLHNGSYIFNDAGLSSSVHYCLYIFFRMDWLPSKIFLKIIYKLV